MAYSSPAYIKTALHYLAVIDEEHDVFSAETLIPMLMDVYKGTEHEAIIRKGIWTGPVARRSQIFTALRPERRDLSQT